jgi:diguanylate cyclase (GGDEF)-like protein
MVRANHLRASTVLVLIGSAAFAAAALAPAVQPALYVFAIGALAATVISAHRKIGLPRPFRVGVASLGALYVGAAVTRAWSSDATIVTIADGLEFLGSVALSATVVQLIGTQRDLDRGVLGDALIVGLGTLLVSWVTMVEPLLRNSTTNLVSNVLSGLYLPTASVVAFLVAVIFFGRSNRPPAMLLICGAVLASVSADVLTGMESAGHFSSAAGIAAGALYTGAYWVAAAAFVHPSTSVMFRLSPAPSGNRFRGRLISTALALVSAIVLLAVHGPESAVDTTVRGLFAILLAIVVAARVVYAVQANGKAQEDLRKIAHTDPLTDLPNRISIREKLDDLLRNAWRTQVTPIVFALDLDRFKNVNDTFGHSAGDELLTILGIRLRSAMPDTTVIGRLSGDEFVVINLAPASHARSAVVMAEEIRDIFRSPFAISPGDVFMSASIGVAVCNVSDRVTAEDLLRQADTAMYRAKDAGRNCVAIFDESMHTRVAHRLAIETALHRALDNDELQLFHQPILDLDTGQVSGFEALMRWQQADGTIISPAEFIPIAEDCGLIVPLGAWALLEALGQLADWVDNGVCSASATMSVNVSPRQLVDPSFPDAVQEALTRSGVTPHQVWLEVTEGTMVSEPEIALASLRRLRALGVRIALDDFGTGYSSLSLVQKFPLQRLKIDRAFVQGVVENSNDRSLVRTIVAMGRSLGLDLVAEGVESVHQLQILHEVGCSKAQGYLISHPVPSDAMRSTVSALERVGGFPGLRNRVNEPFGV